MRTLFNHGINFEDLYKSVDKNILRKRPVYYLKALGYESGMLIHEVYSKPLQFMLTRAFQRMIRDKVRFVVPYVKDTYIDFDTITDDDVLTKRQEGIYQYVDLVESDFTLYSIKYHFSTGISKKILGVFLGGDLKKEFISRVNAGEKFYTIKDLKLTDLLPEVYEEFPEFTKGEIRRLLSIGFKRINAALKYGCYITLNSRMYGNFFVHIGILLPNIKDQVAKYICKRDLKLRKVYKWEKTQHDGYYYIGLNKTGIENWRKTNKGKYRRLIFENVIVRKIMEELFYRYSEVYIFKVRIRVLKKDQARWTLFREKILDKDPIYVGKVTRLKFVPAEITWQQLLKENEEGIS